MEPEDEYKKWLLLLLGLVKYNQAPEDILHEFITSDRYTVAKSLRKFIIDQVCHRKYEFTTTIDAVQ